MRYFQKHEKNKITNKCSAYAYVIFTNTSSQSTQQAKKITGKVVDATGEPIVGASVW